MAQEFAGTGRGTSPALERQLARLDARMNWERVDRTAGVSPAFLAEWLVRRDRPDGVRDALRAGWGTFVGKMGAVALKCAIGVAMIVVSITRAF